MNEEKRRDLAAILEDLKNPDASIRKTAVEECRLLDESSEAITKVLAEMAAADGNKIVAASARQALDSPAQQAILEVHPELKPEEPQESQGIPEKLPQPRKVLVFGTILGVVSAGIFALPVSLVKTSLLWQGIAWGSEYSGDNPGIYCALNILGSAFFGLLASWLGWLIMPKRKGNAWWGFLGGFIFDLLFVFIYFAQ